MVRNGNLILLLALVNLVLSPIYAAIFGERIGHFFVPVNLCFVILGSFTVSRLREGSRIIPIGGILLTTIIVIEFFVPDTRELRIIRSVFSLVFFALVLINVMRHLFKIKSVELEAIWAAVSGYMLIAFTGGALYEIIHICIPESFVFQTEFSTFQLYYFSFTGTTTVGFGDIVPRSPVAQSITMIINIVASLYLAIIMAFFVGKFMNDRSN